MPDGAFTASLAEPNIQDGERMRPFVQERIEGRVIQGLRNRCGDSG